MTVDKDGKPVIGEDGQKVHARVVTVIVEPDEPGIWAFLCHVLSHTEMPQGRLGMVTALIVEK